MPLPVKGSTLANPAYSLLCAADNSAHQNTFLVTDTRVTDKTMRELLLRGKIALLQFTAVCTFCLFALIFPLRGNAQITIAQISDTHLGEAHSPHAFDNLRRAVDMVNARHPDAVIVSGDIGENYDQWLLARGILKWLHAPVYYAPGNHDVHSNDVEKYREVFGPDYYRFQVKGITFLIID